MNDFIVVCILAYAGLITYFNFTKEQTIQDLSVEVNDLDHMLTLHKGVIRPNIFFDLPEQGDKESLCYLSNGTIENCDVRHSISKIYRAGTDDDVTNQVRLILTAEFNYNGH